MKLRLVLILVSLLILITSATGQTAAPDAVVRSFYTYSNARSSTFNARHIELRKRWYTPALYDALSTQLHKDEAYLKKNPGDKPYFGDGLTFRPLDEPCEVGDRSYSRVQRVTRTEIKNTRATVDVTFAYPKACTQNLPPIVYKVNLQKVGGKWLIDDWTYDDGSTLVGDMKAHTY